MTPLTSRIVDARFPPAKFAVVCVSYRIFRRRLGFCDDMSLSKGVWKTLPRAAPQSRAQLHSRRMPSVGSLVQPLKRRGPLGRHSKRVLAVPSVIWNGPGHGQECWISCRSSAPGIGRAQPLPRSFRKRPRDMKPQWRDPGSVPGRTAVHLCPVLPFVPILGFGNLRTRTNNRQKYC